MPCRRRPKGFGFIEFKDTQDAEDCVYKLDRTEFQGREITVRGWAGGTLHWDWHNSRIVPCYPSRVYCLRGCVEGMWVEEAPSPEPGYPWCLQPCCSPNQPPR